MPLLKNNLPKVSIIIPTFNREKFIKTCLDSIYKQKYPKSKIEVLVVDAVTTTDNTRKIAKKYPVRIIDNPKILAEPAKVIGFTKSTGKYYFYLDSDAELVSDTWLLDMVRPLEKDLSLAGSFTRFYPKASQTPYNRYLSYNPLQVWSMLSFILPSIEDVVTKKKEGYAEVLIDPKRTIPIGMGLYRKDFLKKVIADPKNFAYVDIAIALQLAELGHDRFAYVESAGFYHVSDSLLHQVKRLRRDVVVTYLPVIGQRRFQYIDFRNIHDILKIITWVLYVNLLIPSLIVGLIKWIKYKDWAGLYELPSNFILTNYTIYLFLTQKNGQQLLKNIILNRPVSSIKSQSLDYEKGSKLSL